MIPSDNRNKRRIYTHKGISYEILGDRAEHILKDFLYCEETKDWITIKNRITNGIMWGWLKEVK